MIRKLLRTLHAGRLLRVGVKLLLAALVATYLFINRSFLFLLGLYVSLYFFVGSTTFTDLVEDALASEIPGFVSFANAQWGPDPSELRFAHVRIFSENNQEVVHAPAAVFQLDIASTVTGAVETMVRSDAPITVMFDKAVVTDPWVWVEIRDDGSVGLHKAFDTPSTPRDPDAPAPRDLNIHIASVSILDSNGWVESPHFNVEWEGLHLSGDFHVVEFPGTVNFDLPLAKIGIADVYFKPHVIPGTRPSRAHLPIRDLDVTLLQWRGTKFNVARTRGKLDDGAMSFRGWIDTKPERLRIDGTVTADVGADSMLLSQLFGEVLPMSGAVNVTVSGATDIKRWADAEVLVQSRHLEVGDLTLSDLDASLGISPILSVAGHYDHRIDIGRLTTRALGGRVSVAKASYSSVDSRHRLLRPDAQRRSLDVTLELQKVNPWTLITSSALQGPSLGVSLPFLDGALDGRLKLVATQDTGTGATTLHARTGGVTMSWEGGQRGLPLAARYDLNGDLSYALTPPLAPGNDGLRQAESITFEEFGLVSGSDAVTVNGAVDLAARRLNLAASARIGSLGKFVGSLGGSGVDGRLTLQEARLGGTLDDPSLRGVVRITNAELDGRPIGTISGAADLDDGVLVVSDLFSDTPFGTVRASGRVRLWRDDLGHPDPRLPFTIHKLSVDALDLGRLSPQLGLQGVWDVKQSRPLSGNADAPLESLTGELGVNARNVTIAGERARRIQARIVAARDSFRLRDGVINLCRDPTRKRRSGAACRKGGPNITLTGQLDKGFGGPLGPRFKSHIKTRNMPLRTFNVFAGVDDMRGEVTSDIQIEGRFAAPRFFGSVTLDDFGVGNVELGDARLDLTWGRAGEIVVTAMQFFDNMTLQESLIDISKGRFKARFDADIQDLAVFSRLLPALKLHPAIDIVGTGKGRFELDPTGRVPWRLRFDAAPGDVTVTVNDGRTRYVSGDHVRYRMLPDQLRVLAPVRLQSASARDVYVCGGIQNDRWDLEVAGEIGSELLTPLSEVRDLFSALDGSVLVAADPETAKQGRRSRCLQRAGDNLMLVRGELGTPTFQGTLISHKLSFTPRTFGRSVTLDDGGRLKLRVTNRPGRQLVRVEAGKHSLRGEIEDGRFDISGDLYLQDLAIDDADLAVSGSEIYWSSAGEYNLTFNPDVNLDVTDFGDDGTRRIRMTGDVLVTDGNYFKSFDSFARAFGAVTGGGEESYARPLTERVPWLKSLTMGLDVTSTNFTVQSAFPTGKLDLEARLDVTLSGSLDSVTVKRRIDILPDGTITYNLFRRDFEIRHGYLEFDGEGDRPRIELRADTEVEYLERAAGGDDRPEEDKQVTVIVMITGRLPDDLNIELSSQPGGFTQADLERLIVTGKPLRDTASAREDTLFSFDFGNFVNKLLKAPFVDAVKLGLTQEGFVDTQIVTKFGRDVSLRTRAVQEAGDSTRLSARFEFRLTDDIVLEGRAVRSTGNDFTNANERYEARIKYRIPLD